MDRVPISKRCFDLVLTSAGFIGVLPLLLFVAMAVRWTMGTPVFFVQERPGLGLSLIHI